ALGVYMGTAPGQTPPPPIAMNGRTTTGTVSIFVQSSARGGTGDTDVLRVTPRPASAWRLVLQHTAGSLDAAVEQARRRNLWLSFGILGVLAAGVGLIVVNAQRSQRLAA